MNEILFSTCTWCSRSFESLSRRSYCNNCVAIHRENIKSNQRFQDYIKKASISKPTIYPEHDEEVDFDPEDEYRGLHTSQDTIS